MSDVYNCPRMHHPPHEQTPPDTSERSLKVYGNMGEVDPPSQIYLMSHSQESPPPNLPISPPHPFAHLFQYFTMAKCPPFRPLLSHPNSPQIPLHACSTTASSVEYHEVKLTRCMDNEPEHSCSVQCYGLNRKTDQFWIDPTQRCVPGRCCHHCLHLALEKCSGISLHAHIPCWLCVACMPTTISTPAPIRHCYDNTMHQL